MANSSQSKLHVVFLPYYITSHIIPVVDTARLFAARGGFKVTIITTPSNARLFQDSVDRDIAAFKSQITVLKLNFPSSEVNLPEGVENFSSITTVSELLSKFFPAMELLRKPTEQLIRDLRPDCIVSDMYFPWTADLAKELSIPRLVQVNNCFFPSVVTHSLKLHAPQLNLDSDSSESFLVPGLPHEISMKRSELEEYLKRRTRYGDMMDAIEESFNRSYGMIFTTYYELEPTYVDYYTRVTERKCWHIGLASQFINNVMSHKKPSSKTSIVMEWLDDKEEESVVYICFGSMTCFPDNQLREIALALEESRCNFIWVVRKKNEPTGDGLKAGEEAWLPEGYEERLKGTKKGLIIREWAPQSAILEHDATGAFMTHCGWNSSLEGIIAGVPLIAWPLFSEQFYNEKLITRVLKTGVTVGSEVHNLGFEINSPLVKKDKIVEAINYLMGGGSDEVRNIRRRAKELSLATKRSQEEGGSSSNSLDSLIKEIVENHANNKVTD